MKLLVPVLLGLSVCGVGSALIYQYFRTRDQKRLNRKEEDDVDNDNNVGPALHAADSCLTKCEQIEDEIIMATLLIHNEFMPVVVGPNSLNLRSLESKTKTKISFSEAEIVESHQVCCIRGTSAAVADAQKILRQIIAKPVMVTEEIEVSQSACGKIIGRCGEMLQEICRKSGAKVSVNSNDVRRRCVLIIGTRTQVNSARALIEEKVQEDRDIRRAIEESELKRERRGEQKATSFNGSQSSLVDSLTASSSKAERLSATSAGGQMEVYVSAIASPSKFWLQLVGPQSTELDSLIETMTEYYVQPENQRVHHIEEPYLDQIVAAMFKWDNKWYRAKIVAILPNEYAASDMVLDIYFLDYGDSSYVAPNEVFQLRTDFLQLRFQAIECFLANVAPNDQAQSAGSTADGPQTRFKWKDSKAIERFEELSHVAQWEMLLCRVVCYDEEKKAAAGNGTSPGIESDNSEAAESRTAQRRLLGRREGSPVPGVELYDSVNGRDVNIGQELVKEGLAIELNRRHAFLGTPTLVANSSGANSENSSRTLSPAGSMNGGAVVGRLPPSSPTDEFSRFSSIHENSTNENVENSHFEQRQEAHHHDHHQ